MNSPFSTPWQTGLKKAIQERTSIFVLSDANLPPEYLEEVLEVCGTSLPINIHSIKGGEQIKTLEQAELLYLELDSVGAERKTLIVCLGGGTITDLGGFVTSTYKRGLELVLLPTTLLGMVDAAIGGKNGVNLSTQDGVVKNQVGTFYLPKFIGFNPDWLKSLELREIRSGWAEMAKHALLTGAGGFLDDLLKVNEITADNLGPLITRAAEVKRRIVNEDPLENGPRAGLNLGHTVGHALEAIAMQSSEHITHGEGVAWGLAFMLEASVDKLEFDAERGASLGDWIIRSIIEPIELSRAGKIWPIMLKDKKNQFGNVTDILLRSEGDVMLDFVWEEDEFTILWEQFRKKHA